jgi:hypothetical protein
MKITIHVTQPLEFQNKKDKEKNYKRVQRYKNPFKSPLIMYKSHNKSMCLNLRLHAQTIIAA